MKSIQSIFPRASKSFLEVNKVPLGPVSEYIDANKDKNDSTGILSAPRAKRGRMNKTEAEFAMILEAMKRKGEILRFEFQGITLRWFDMHYTPDFYVRGALGNEDIRLIEVKGSHIHYRQQALARFKGARGFWPEFTFEMHQKTKEGWKQIL